jgi:hypothetical protein
MSDHRIPLVAADRVGPTLRQADKAAAGRVSRKTQEAATNHHRPPFVAADRVRVSRKTQEAATNHHRPPFVAADRVRVSRKTQEVA